MKCNGIDRIDIFNAVLLDTVTLECIFSFLNLSTRIQILYSYSAFNRAEHISLFVREASYTASLILQRGFTSLLHVSHVTKVPYKNPPTRRTDHQLITAHRHCINLIWLRKGTSTAWCARIPEFHCGIPTTSDNNINIRTELYTANRLVMNTHCRIMLSIKVKCPESFVQTTTIRMSTICKAAV